MYFYFSTLYFIFYDDERCNTNFPVRDNKVLLYCIVFITYHGKEPDAGCCDGVDTATYHDKEPDAGCSDGVDNATYHGKEPDAGCCDGVDTATYHGKEPDAGCCDGVDTATYHGKEPDAGCCDGGAVLRLVQAVRQQLTDQVR